MADSLQLDHLLSLPLDERARLAKALLESLHEPLDSDADVAWANELERRAIDVGENPQELIEASDLHRRLESRLRSR